MGHRLLVLSVLAGALAGACGKAPTNPLAESRLAVVDAAVRLLDLEGGCWTLEVSQKVHYLPIDIPTQFRQDGLPVRATVLRLDDYSSACMVGPVVQLLSIQPR
jgi:hypothetical protein